MTKIAVAWLRKEDWPRWHEIDSGLPPYDRWLETINHGIAIADAGGATAVQVKVGKAGFKSARGGASWRFVAKLAPGKNKIVVRATGPGGTKTVVLKITRR